MNGRSGHSPRGRSGPLPPDRAMLRVHLAGYTVHEVSPALTDLLAQPAGGIVGQTIDALWHPAERDAIRARLDDVVVLGHDRIAAVALRRPERCPPLWVAIDAEYRAHGREGLELAFRALEPPQPPHATPDRAAQAIRPDSPGPAAESGDDETAVALALADAGGVGILVVDEHRHVRAVGRRATRFVPAPFPEDGLPLAEIFRLDDDARQTLAMSEQLGHRQRLRARTTRSGEDVVVDYVPSGRAAGGYLVVSPLPEDDGRTTWLLQAEWAMRRISHDSRSHLGGVIAGLEMLQEALEEGRIHGDGVREILGDMRDACDAALDVIEHVHDAQRRTASKNERVLDLEALLRESVKQCMRTADKHGVTIHTQLTPNTAVRADGTRLRRVFHNLIENAIRVMGEGGELTIRSEIEDQDLPGVHVAVADTGPGIPEDQLERIFLPGVSSAEDSDGLGLAIVRDFVVDSGGQIRCESAPGEGATFHVWLPRAAGR